MAAPRCDFAWKKCTVLGTSLSPVRTNVAGGMWIEGIIWCKVFPLHIAIPCCGTVIPEIDDARGQHALCSISRALRV